MASHHLQSNENATPTVTVLMSVYNAESFVREAVESILGQTLKDFELIVIDDCSTDNSWAVIKECATQDSRIVTLQNEVNTGAAGALNCGLTVARGQYITRQDGDDIALSDRLEKQVGYLKTHSDVGLVGTAVFLVDADNKVIKSITYPTQNEEIQEILLDTMCFCGPTVMAERYLFEGVGFCFDEQLSGSEDYDFCLRLAEVTKMANLVEPLYRYRQHGDSVSHKKRAQQMFRKALALEKAGHRRKGAELDDAFQEMVARDYLRASILFYTGGEVNEARKQLQYALNICSSIFDNQDTLYKILKRYRPSDVEQALVFTENIFDELLPKNRQLAGQKSRMLAELHMEEAFAAHELNERERVRAHLWAGIRNDPTWLRNRGVWAILKSSMSSRR